MRSYARCLFLSAGFVNIVVAAVLLLRRSWLAPFAHLDPISGTNLVLLNLTSCFIALFGYAYFRIAFDPVTFRSYIHFSAAGKLMAFVAAAVPWLMGIVAANLPLLLLVDVLFAFVFIDYLRRTRGTNLDGAARPDRQALPE
jgi:hypothetical protein